MTYFCYNTKTELVEFTQKGTVDNKYLEEYRSINITHRNKSPCTHIEI